MDKFMHNLGQGRAGGGGENIPCDLGGKRTKDGDLQNRFWVLNREIIEASPNGPGGGGNVL